MCSPLLEAFKQAKCAVMLRKGRCSFFCCSFCQEIERRRSMMRQRAQERKNEEMEVMEVEDEGRSGEESESESEYEEYTDSEDETEPRLKPVFIRK